MITMNNAVVSGLRLCCPFEAKDRETFGILGPSGADKTTIIKIL